MKRLFLLVAAAAATVAVATTGASANDNEAVGPAGVALSAAPFDQQFIDVMAAHHAMAIEMAKMAVVRAKHPELKTLGRQVIAAQSKEIREFRALRKRWYGSATFRDYAMNDAMMHTMGVAPNDMAQLMRTPRFDHAFVSAMIPHHAGAITMARWETQAGTHPQLRKIAMNIIRDQAKEVGQMIGWRVAWYGG